MNEEDLIPAPPAPPAPPEVHWVRYENGELRAWGSCRPVDLPPDATVVDAPPPTPTLPSFLELLALHK